MSSEKENEKSELKRRWTQAMMPPWDLRSSQGALSFLVQ